MSTKEKIAETLRFAGIFFRVSKSLTPFQEKEVSEELDYPSREEYAEDLATEIKLSVRKALENSVPPYVLEHLTSQDQEVGEVEVDHYDDASQITFRIPPIINTPWEFSTYDDMGVKPRVESKLDEIYLDAYDNIVTQFWNTIENEDTPYGIQRINAIGEHDSTPLTGFYYILEIY